MADLVVDRLTKEYPTPTTPLRVLHEVSLQLSRGDNLAIVGPSGSGKSTLLHVLGTLDQPTSGSVRLNGEDPFRLADTQLARFRNRNIGFIFQDHHLLPQLTAIENVLVPTLARGKASPEEIQTATDLFAHVGLSDRAHHRPAELSGGERQRVAIARALICRPALVLADEPTGNLDRTNGALVADLLLEIQSRSDPGMIMIVVTHSQELADRMRRKVELVDGQLSMERS